MSILSLADSAYKLPYAASEHFPFSYESQYTTATPSGTGASRVSVTAAGMTNMRTRQAQQSAHPDQSPNPTFEKVHQGGKPVVNTDTCNSTATGGTKGNSSRAPQEDAYASSGSLSSTVSSDSSLVVPSYQRSVLDAHFLCLCSALVYEDQRIVEDITVNR